MDLGSSDGGDAKVHSERTKPSLGSNRSQRWKCQLLTSVSAFSCSPVYKCVSSYYVVACAIIKKHKKTAFTQKEPKLVGDLI